MSSTSSQGLADSVLASNEPECGQSRSAKSTRAVERSLAKKWPIIGSKYGVGNWCWNGYWMSIPVAVDFLTWLHGKDTFHCTSGEERLFNIWNSPRPFDEDDRKFIWRLLGKPSMYGQSGWRADPPIKEAARS